MSRISLFTEAFRLRMELKNNVYSLFHFKLFQVY